MTRECSEVGEAWPAFDVALITALLGVVLFVAPAVLALLYNPLIGGLLLVAQLFWITWYASPVSTEWWRNVRQYV